MKNKDFKDLLNSIAQAREIHNKMKKPKKKKFNSQAKTQEQSDKDVRMYNQAYDVWEKYHNYIIKEIILKSYKRLEGWNKANKGIIKLQSQIRELPSDQELYDLALDYLGKLDSKTTKFVKAISKRLREKTNRRTGE